MQVRHVGCVCQRFMCNQPPLVVCRQAVAKLQQATAATRKEVDWQAQLDALVDARRLIAHHTEVRVCVCLCCVLLSSHPDVLRMQLVQSVRQVADVPRGKTHCCGFTGVHAHTPAFMTYRHDVGIIIVSCCCPQVLRPPAARELVLAALPSVDDLRSTTSRMALLFFQVSLGARGGGCSHTHMYVMICLWRTHCVQCDTPE